MKKKAERQNLQRIHEWIRIVDAYRTGNPVKTCPFCGEQDALDIGVTNFGRISYTAICRKCGQRVHLDGLHSE